MYFICLPFCLPASCINYDFGQHISLSLSVSLANFHLLAQPLINVSGRDFDISEPFPEAMDRP